MKELLPSNQWEINDIFNAYIEHIEAPARKLGFTQEIKTFTEVKQYPRQARQERLVILIRLEKPL